VKLYYHVSVPTSGLNDLLSFRGEEYQASAWSDVEEGVPSLK